MRRLMRSELRTGYAHVVDDRKLHAAMLKAQEGRNPEVWLRISEVARLHGFGIEATRHSLRRLIGNGLVRVQWESGNGVGKYRYWAQREVSS